ncbi:branched-chain amino acid transport system permease protein [Variovorax boronicumulans]|uniref:Branched-chain amino acid transport system permease protein n=1 Tax=Variovorax boronicumulans TaxID=436515 RepID=A0AAW8DSA5_9BURK|nr:branched-chain amino acid ABC transporter permease [Variovorax boronicumulans]MDP9876796.1 branched-chain amino acid transport system permease protein [Variovorax boronicumulans]MDP9922327.1 branched-chain amino acid transport system permease protein [Variovorax boronicumulans]
MRPPSLVPWLGFTAAALAIAFAPTVADGGLLRLLSEVLITLAMAQMWNLLAGYTGLVSMGHQAFAGIGAYLLFVASDRLGISPYWMVPVAGLGGALLAAVVAPLMFRLRDAYFSIGMWVLAEIVRLLVAKFPLFGGESGVPLQAVRLVEAESFQQNAFWISGAIGLAAVAGVYLLMRSPFGLGLMAVRDNELAATSIGVNVWRNRFIAFVLSGLGFGLAGGAHFMGTMFVSPDSAFDINWVVTAMFIVIIGGIGTIEGPLIGTVIYFGLRELFNTWFAMSGGWYLIAMGCIAIAVMLLAPRGLWGLARERWGWRGLSVQRHPPPRDEASLSAPLPPSTQQGRTA